MNENMSTGKIFVGGMGIVGLIGAAIYIYKRVKDAKKPIEITLDEGADENAESVEGQETTESSEETKAVEKAEKKAAITEKISKVSKKIGKSVGTFCLKFGAKHPKIAKGVLTVVQYAPTITVALICGVLLRKQYRATSGWQEQDSIDASDIITESLHDDRFGDDTLYMTTHDANAKDSIDIWKNSDLSENYLKIQELLNNLNLSYSEHYEIDEKQYFMEEHPEHDVSMIKEPYILRQKFNVPALREQMSKQQEVA